MNESLESVTSETMPLSLVSESPRQFETITCSRCGGSGHYSYCQSYGTTCFKCAGSKRVYTKRGRAAVDYFNSLRSKPLKDFVVGDLMYNESGPLNKGGFSRVTESKADAYNAGYWTVSTEAMGYSGNPNTLRKVGLSKERKQELLSQAYDYQETLTKTGTPRKAKLSRPIAWNPDARAKTEVLSSVL
jgi:hypothetical protein